jgi:hypothetical protein
VAIALIVGPLHYRLLSGETMSPAILETLVPMILSALGATEPDGHER